MNTSRNKPSCQSLNLVISKSNLVKGFFFFNFILSVCFMIEVKIYLDSSLLIKRIVMILFLVLDFVDAKQAQGFLTFFKNLSSVRIYFLLVTILLCNC